MSLLMRAAVRGERLLYRISGLPVALRASFRGRRTSPGDVIRSAYARAYWRPARWDGYIELAVAIILSPVAPILAAAWFTARNGPLIRNREGNGLARQFADQLALYWSDGVLAPWYYIFELHRHAPGRAAGDFLERSESIGGVYPLLRRGVTTELNDKKVFADYCAAKGVRCIPYLLYLDGKEAPAALPERDLFVKKAGGRGGRGAERWDHVKRGLFKSPEGERLTSGELLDRLTTRAKIDPLLIQEQVRPHRDLTDLTTGALPTVRVTTCLDEGGEPEIMSAVFRMAIGKNRTVDNLHAGGIASEVRLENGILSIASNLGMDARIGWHERHPDSGVMFAGYPIPFWTETKALAIEAHRAFADRVMIGWDIAITDDGPIIVEGNSSPDLDIVQRFGAPVCNSRFGELLAWHLRKLGFAD
jgi:hypothetical protein